MAVARSKTLRQGEELWFVQVHSRATDRLCEAHHIQHAPLRPEASRGAPHHAIRFAPSN